MLRSLSALILIAALGAVAGYYWRGEPRTSPEPTTELELKEGPSVVTALRALAHLEGASFHLQRVIDLREKQRLAFGLLEVEDAILLVASGEVRAGVELGDLGEGAIEVDRQAGIARVRLPAPSISSSKIDNERSYVHTRSTDLLAQREVQLESQARRLAERGFVAAAVEAGILDEARRNVAATVEALLRSLGFEQVEVSFEPTETEAAGTEY